MNNQLTTDLQKIEQTIKDARDMFFSYRWGGKNQEYKDAIDAIEALQRVKNEFEARQMRLEL